MEIRVKDLTTKKTYTSNMAADNKQVIIEIHFCTSYTQVIVQDEVDGKFETHDIFIDPIGSKACPFDLMAIKEADHYGELTITKETNNETN